MPDGEGDGQEVLQVEFRKGEETARAVSRTALRPTVQAAATLCQFQGGKFPDATLLGLVEALSEQTRAAIKGDTDRAEAMLTAQAHTLDAIFNNLAQRAVSAEYLSQFQAYLWLSLRAQSQCRATLETLATVQNPPMANYVGQANIAHGPQQVNNGPTGSRAGRRTFGGDRWRMAGHRSGGRGKRSQFGAGSRGSSRRGRGRLRGRRGRRGMPTRVL